MCVKASGIDEVWTCLVKLGGALEDHRESFRQAVISHDQKFPFEFRFMGHFGFGGKVRMKHGYFQASCYSEDMTEDRDKKLEVLNHNLARLIW